MEKALKQRQLHQMQDQLPQLDAMIARAKTAKDVKRFQGWRVQFRRTLRKEGIKVPAAKTANIGKFKINAEHRKQVLEYIKAQPQGKRGSWSEFARFVGVSGTNLGVVVRDMLKAGTISEPAGNGSMTYVVVPPKARAAAKKLYAEQRKDIDSPKGSAPVSLEKRREANARKAA